MNFQRLIFGLLAAIVLINVSVQGQVDTNGLPPQILELARQLKYQQGEIDLRGGLAKLTVPADFNFLDADDAETVLVKLCWAAKESWS
jgi:hypothetical protein